MALENESDGNSKYSFIPHLDFISSGKFKFPQNQYNVSPLSKRVPKGITSVKVSLGAIGHSAEYDRELVASILKDTICKFVSSFYSVKHYYNDIDYFIKFKCQRYID